VKNNAILKLIAERKHLLEYHGHSLAFGAKTFLLIPQEKCAVSGIIRLSDLLTND
jgi:hypothetical protein